MEQVTKQTLINLEKTLVKQDQKGIKKYGVPLNPNDDYNWGKMADEEMADYLKYRECERQEKVQAIKLLKSALKQESVSTINQYVVEALYLMEKSR